MTGLFSSVVSLVNVFLPDINRPIDCPLGISCRVTVFYIERLLVIPCGIDSAAIKIDGFYYIIFLIMSIHIDEFLSLIHI